MKETEIKKLKYLLEDYLNMKGISTRKNFSCLNPSHRDKHPSMRYCAGNASAEPFVKCFSCGVKYDLFDLIGIDYNISSFIEQIKKACEIFNLPVTDYLDDNVNQKAKSNFSSKNLSGQSAKSKYAEKINNNDNAFKNSNYFKNTNKSQEITKFTDFYVRWNNNLPNVINNETLTYRGISKGLLDKFKIGYCSNWKHPKLAHIKDAKYSKRIIIPIDCSHYVARLYDSKGDEKIKMKVGEGAPPFNYKTIENKDITSPIFIVEGEFDALSILEVGGDAIATGGLSFTSLEFLLKNTNITRPFIIALDNDEAGNNAVNRLEEVLIKSGAMYYKPDSLSVIYASHKDANDFLVNDKNGFIYHIKKISEEALACISKKHEEEKSQYYEKSNQNLLFTDFLPYLQRKKSSPVISSGFSSLDHIFNGGLNTGLYLLGAVSSRGRTTFSMQIAANIAKQGKDVLIYSLEMSRNELISKDLSRISFEKANINSASDVILKKDSLFTTFEISRLRNADNSEFNRKREICLNNVITTYSNEIANHLFVIEGNSDMSAKKIREDVLYHKSVTGNVPYVIVDYIQILSSELNITGLSDEQVVNRNITELKRISRDFDTVVLGISSFDRNSYSSPASLSSFKNGGMIEYSADVLLGLQFKNMDFFKNETAEEYKHRILRLTEKENEKAKSNLPQSLELKILKNCKGAKGSVLFDFYPNYNVFVETLEIVKK